MESTLIVASWRRALSLLRLLTYKGSLDTIANALKSREQSTSNRQGASRRTSRYRPDTPTDTQTNRCNTFSDTRGHGHTIAVLYSFADSFTNKQGSASHCVCAV
jgi:hypothetical protein